MTQFDDREQAFEKKFARDEEFEFKVAARRNKLLGLWAADLMGITGDDASAYAADVIASDFEEAGDEDVYRKVAGDLSEKNVDVSEHQIRREMEDLMTKAREQLAEELGRNA